jgi:hypothetical protein
MLAKRRFWAISFISVVLLVGCGVAELGQELPIDPETGKQLLDPPEGSGLGKADNVDGDSGPKTGGLAASSAAWKVTGRWYHTDPAAGIAWPASSSLTWDEKYAAWVESLKQTAAQSGYGKSFTLTTPWGKEVPAPALECAETAMFLRATFASWYGLPFYMEAYSSTYGRIYYGHFGIVKRNGSRVPGTPSFATAYVDHTASLAGKTDAEIVAAWPTDSTLRQRYLTKLKDDKNPFLGEEAYSGAYFDEIFLNKRVGYLLLQLLTNFGSMHVASDRNTFNLEPTGLREGDVLVERWQRQGIGHTLVVKTVDDLGEGRMDAELVYGSMPRIQPKWYSASLSKSYFTSNYTGGVGTNSEGDEYAKLGGGLKRWRTPVVKYGAWYNIVPVRDRASYIGSTDYEAISKRPAQFQTMLGNLTPEEQRQVYLQEIDNARQNLRLKPASCSNRTRREEAFAKLYKLNQDKFGLSREQTDKTYRKLEDYVFAELEYNKSKTCCWNSTTEEMYKIVLEYNKQHVYDEATQTCNAPVVFKASNGTYDLFKQYAISIGKGHLWVEWSADETCPQASDPTLTDTETAHAWTPLCSIVDAIFGGGSGSGSSYQDGQPCGTVTWEGLCDGQTAVWCEGGQIQTYTCQGNTSCGYYDAGGYYWCV